jgi:PAS domain S-box-containing protein
MITDSAASFQANILVVDDLPDNLRVLQDSIGALGYRVRCAKSGAMALTAVEADAPDLILLDVKMPLMDGYEVCRRLKASEASRDIPIIFLSANSEVFDKVKAFELGGADYITKPFLIEEIVVRIQHQLSLKMAQVRIKQANELLEQRVQERTALLNQEINERKRAEAIQQAYLRELEDWRVRYEQAGILSGQILFELDLQTNIPTWGANTAKLLGYSADEMPKTWDAWVNLIHPEDRNKYIAEFCKQSTTKLEYRLQHGDGSYIWIEDNTHVFQDQEGSPLALIGFIAEITERKKAELALRESESRFRLLSELAPIGIFHADLDGKILYENPFLLEMLGLEEDPHTDQPWTHFIHPDDLDAVLQGFQSFLQSASHWSAEFRLVGNQNQVFWILGQANSIVSDNAEVLGHFGILTNITAQKLSVETLKSVNEDLEGRVTARTSELQTSNLKLRIENLMRKHHIQERQRAEIALSEVNSQLQAVLDAVPGCVAWISSDLTYFGVNLRMAKMFGRSPEEFVGKKTDEVKGVDGRLTEFIQAFFAGQKDYLAQEIELQVGQVTKCHLIVAQQYRQRKAAVLIGVDISERKQAELERENALKQAQDLSDLKSRFISITSHEFRTPLTTIFSASELLEHYGEKWPRTKEIHYLKQIQSSVQHMTLLLDDVLIVSAGEAGKLKLDPSLMDIISFCETLVEELKISKNCRQDIEFKALSEHRLACLDEKYIRHILSNLLSNAVKYSPESARIQFDVVVSDQAVRFRVKDEGIGIPLADQERLFDLFHRAENVGTTPGTGLGLSIVKKAVDLHHGSIDVKSEIGKGTEFTVILPLT